MDLSPDGYTLRVVSASAFTFDAEKSGKKCNILLPLTSTQYDDLNRKPPQKIIIQYEDEVFLRTVSDIRALGSICQTLFVNLSWKHHSLVDTTQILDSQQTVIIPISKKLKNDLDAHRADLTYDQYILDILTYYTEPPHSTSREI